MRRRRGDARRGGIGMPAPTLEPVTIFIEGSARQLVAVGWTPPAAVKLERGRKVRFWCVGREITAAPAPLRWWQAAPGDASQTHT